MFSFWPSHWSVRLAMRMFRRRQDTDSYLFLLDYILLYPGVLWTCLFLYDLHHSLLWADFLIIFVALVCPSHSEWLLFLSKEILLNCTGNTFQNQFLDKVQYRDGYQTSVAEYPDFLSADSEPIYFQWIPELKHYAPGVPIILVGTKLGKNNAVLNFEKSILLCM